MRTVKRNTLSNNEEFILWKWVEENKELVAKMTDLDSAKSASEALEIEVTPSNMSAARKAVGVTKNRAKGSNKSAANAIAKALVDLIDHLNAQKITDHKIPHTLIQIAKKERM